MPTRSIAPNASGTTTKNQPTCTGKLAARIANPRSTMPKLSDQNTTMIQMTSTFSTRCSNCRNTGGSSSVNIWILTLALLR